MTEKIAEFAPIPKARTSTAARLSRGLRRLHQFFVTDDREPVERRTEALPRCRQADAEVLRHTETIAGRQQDAVLQREAAEIAAARAIGETRERRHAAAGCGVLEAAGAIGEELFEQRKVFRHHTARPAVDGVPVRQRQRAQSFADAGAADREVTAAVQILGAARGIGLDDPTQAQSAEAERLGKIAERSGMRQALRGACGSAVVDRVI